MSDGKKHEALGKFAFVPAFYIPYHYVLPLVPFGVGQLVALFIATSAIANGGSLLPILWGCTPSI